MTKFGGIGRCADHSDCVRCKEGR